MKEETKNNLITFTAVLLQTPIFDITMYEKQFLKKQSLCILLFLAILATTKAQEKQWTLQECIAYALENNITVQQSELDVDFADIDRIDALGALLPSIEASANNNWNTGLTQNVVTGTLQTQTNRNSSYSLTAGVNLYNGLQTFRQMQRAKLSKLAGQYSLQRIKDDISLAVANSYLQVLTAKENLAIVQAQNLVTQEQLQRTNDLVDAGVLPAGDLLEIKANSLNEQSRIIAAENTIQIARISLAQLLRIEDYQSFRLSSQSYEVPLTTILEKSVDEILAEAKNTRYEIREAEANMSLAEKDIQIARGAYQPRLNAFFNYNTRESDFPQTSEVIVDPDAPGIPIGIVEGTNQRVLRPSTIVRQGAPAPFFDQLSTNDGVSYGFSLTVPIFNGFSTRNNVKRSKINLKRSENQLEQTKLDLESNVYQAYTDVRGAKELYIAAVATEEARQQAYQFAKDRYDVGLINSFDFSQAKLQLDNAQSETVRTKYDYIFRLKVLELYFGVPMNSIDQE